MKVRVDGEIKDITPKMQVDRYVIHDIELVVDRLQVTTELRSRLSQSVQQTMKLGKDLMFVAPSPPEGARAGVGGAEDRPARGWGGGRTRRSNGPSVVEIDAIIWRPASTGPS